MHKMCKIVIDNYIRKWDMLIPPHKPYAIAYKSNPRAVHIKITLRLNAFAKHQ